MRYYLYVVPAYIYIYLSGLRNPHIFGGAESLAAAGSQRRGGGGSGEHAPKYFLRFMGVSDISY